MVKTTKVVISVTSDFTLLDSMKLGMNIFLVILLGVIPDSHEQVSGSVLEKILRPGDNITLYCDYKPSDGELTVWYRNCSHENQPTLDLRPHHSSQNTDDHQWLSLPRFQFAKNDSSGSYDLLIVNVTYSDEGSYFCGTYRNEVEDKKCINQRIVKKYGKITTRIRLNSSEPHRPQTPQARDGCWILLFSLCPAVAVLSSFLSALVVYFLFCKPAKDPQVQPHKRESAGQAGPNQGEEDVCYAAINIPSGTAKTKKKKYEADVVYSAVNAFQMKTA